MIELIKISTKRLYPVSVMRLPSGECCTRKFVQVGYSNELYVKYLISNTKFQAQLENWKSSYKVRQSLALFCNLTDLILG